MRVSCLFLILVLSALSWEVKGQAADVKPDTSRILDEVVVKSYSADRPLAEVPASIDVVSREKLLRFSNNSFVPVFNGLPGVRMEERSPGSYRFSIRGSMLRSPFGIRNVKFYWNGLPLTDGGGNTYFNLMDFSSIGQAEVIKGPGGSLYGAGTGGVVLLTTAPIQQTQIQLSAQGGSYGAQRYQALVQARSDNVFTRIQFAHQQADGYRKQSAMRRDAFNADLTFLLTPRTTLTTTILYSDLYYQTPGGLTETQYFTDPSQARPGNPGAEAQKAAVTNKTYYGSVNLEHTWRDRLISRLGIFGSQTDFKNPAIRNYESRDEHNLGLRNENTFQFEVNQWKSKLNFGAELQGMNSSILVTSNNQGTPGAVTFSNDKVFSWLALGYVQLDVDLPRQFYFTLAGSLNYVKYEDQRLDISPVVTQTRKFDPVLSPRVALLKKFTPSLSAFIQFCKGFSPPTTAELIPSTGIYNPNLNPETGYNTEVGVRGSLFKVMHFSLAAYDFQLKETIVIQRDVSGADFFVNAGNTVQRGAEAALSWQKNFSSKSLNSLQLSGTYTWNHYRFGQYINDGKDYSGNKLTGVAPTIFWIGADLRAFSRFYLNLTAQFTDRMPLNDGNTDFASDYFLAGFRIGYKSSTKFPFEIFCGADNLLDQRYSLGNDLNAAGGRYYNAAPRRNFYAGLSVKLFKESK